MTLCYYQGMKIKQIYSDNNLAIQQKPYTCGPVSLLNVLQLKGDFSRTEDELAELCDAKPEIGTSNENMVKVAKQIDLGVIEVKQDASVEDLERSIDQGLSVIICYRHLYSGGGHYGLITEHDEKAFYFRDCSYGFIRICKEDLKKFWYNQDKTVHGWFMAVK